MSKKKKEDAKNAPKVAVNRRARFDYSFDEEHEAGIVLIGSEVKSIYAGKVNLTDGYCLVINGEMFLMNVDVEPYDRAAAAFLPDRRRDRKLLLHRNEIESLARKVREKGYSLIPLETYFKRGKVKVKVGLGKGRGFHDKRHAIAEKETKREVARVKVGQLD
ncbi:MAG: SsrA-binding protein [Armatimonadota bacterium]